MSKNHLISNKVQQYMNKRGISQTELADQVPCNRSCISRLVNGKAKRLTLSRGLRIAEILGTTVEEIFTFQK